MVQTGFWTGIDTASQSLAKNVLREQAELLGKITNNIVEANISTTLTADEHDGFVNAPTYTHCFDIIAPILGYQKFTLFCVFQTVGIEYPLNFYSNYWKKKGQCKCSSPEEFNNCLKEILSSEETAKLINSIIAQSA